MLEKPVGSCTSTHVEEQYSKASDLNLGIFRLLGDTNLNAFLRYDIELILKIEEDLIERVESISMGFAFPALYLKS